MIKIAQNLNLEKYFSSFNIPPALTDLCQMLLNFSETNANISNAEETKGEGLLPSTMIENGERVESVKMFSGLLSNKGVYR